MGASEENLGIRPRPGLIGSREFVASMGTLRSRPEILRHGPEANSEGIVPSEQVALGTYDSDAGEGEVWVRLDRSGELELARTAGFAPQFEFQFGDEIGVQVLDGVAQTIPTVKHTIVHEDRVEFWAVNRATGRFRLLASSSYE